MEVWRLCRRPYADLSGNGARIFGGRWNSPGRPVVYFAEHPALAALEVRVHLDLPFELLPNDFVLMHVSSPNRLISGLGETVSAERTIAVGDAWFDERRSAALRVPSILIPNAWNILLNPHHPNALQAHVVGLEPFDFDPRLWQPLAGEG
jgi:RES domain-containing protein